MLQYMSEQWAIAFFTIAATFAGSVLVYLIKELKEFKNETSEKLDKMVESLRSFVTKTECDSDMAQHCDRIEKLSGTVTQLSIDMAKYAQRIANLEVSNHSK